MNSDLILKYSSIIFHFFNYNIENLNYFRIQNDMILDLEF